VEEVIEDGNDVVARVHIKARGQGSGVAADVRFFAQFKVRDDKVAYITTTKTVRRPSKPPGFGVGDVAGECGGAPPCSGGGEEERPSHPLRAS
jgi:hypothetical protein